MKLHRYLGCMYDLYFEEINIRFLVHKSLIVEDTRNLLLFYVITGHAPGEIRVDTENNIIRFTPEKHGYKDIPAADHVSFWFAL